MSSWEKWVLDATMGGPPFCFCPIDGDLDGEFSIVTGMNSLGAPLGNGKLVAVVHEDGQEAADEFYEQHKAEIDEILAESRKAADTIG